MAISLIESGAREGQIDRIVFSDVYNEFVIKNLIWEEIPNFAVITGKNGVGKTQLLYQIMICANTLEKKKVIVYRQDSYSQSISSSYKKPDLLMTNDENLVQLFRKYAITKDVNDLGSFKHHNFGQDLMKKIDSGEFGNPNDDLFDISVSKMIVSYPLNYDMGDVISDPVSILYQVFLLFDDKIKKHKWYISDSNKAGFLFDFYCRKENITNANYDHFKRFLKEQAHPNFMEELLEKYEETELKLEHPCKEVNKLLIKYNFTYQLLWQTNNEGRKEIQFIKIINKKLISFSGLSSGEKVILDLLAWLFYFKGLSAEENKKLDITRTNLMLLDEPDSHLDPPYCETFYNIIYEEFVKTFNIQVLMTTHRMDTVNLAPDQSVFIMENDHEIRCNKTDALIRMNPSLRLATSREANSALSEGKYVIQPNVNFVLVENEDDAKFYSIIYHKLSQIKKLTNYSTQTIFTPVGIKVIRPEVLDELAIYISNFSLGSNSPDVQTCKSLINKLKSKNDAGGGCSNVKKKVVIKGYKFDNIDEKLGAVEIPVKKQNIEEPPVMYWGLIDNDDKNKPKNSLHVIDVYSFENYLCMPLNLFYLFCERNDSQSETFRTKKERLEQLLKNDEVNTQVIDNAGIESMSQECTSQELEEDLNDMVIDCASKAIESLIEKLKEKKKTAGNKVKTLEKFEESLQSTDTKAVKLVNNIVILCPSIFLEGFDFSINGKGNSAKGHNLIEVINYIIYEREFNKKSEYHFLKALCSLPANLLPESILISINNLATSKLYKENIDRKRKQIEELQPTCKKSSSNM